MKKIFVRMVIVSLTLSALVGIAILLFGELGAVEFQILMSTLAIGWYSVMGLCASTLYDKNKREYVGHLGMWVSCIGLIYTLLVIWFDLGQALFDSNGLALLLSFIVVTAAIAHISLFLGLEPKNRLVRNLQITTIIMICIVSLILLDWFRDDFESSDMTFRLLGVFAILDVLGTIITPIVQKTSRSA